MRFIINNLVTEVIFGGSDNLLDVNLKREVEKFLTVAVKDSYWATKNSAVNKRNNGYKWDGKKRFITATGKMMTGLVPMVAKFATRLGAKITVEDKRTNIIQFKPKEDRDYTILGENLFKHQIEAVDSCERYITIGDNSIYFPRGVIDAATNAGKTWVMASAIKNAINPVALIVVHNTLIYDAHVKFFTKVFGKVGRIDSTHYDIQPVTIAMSKTASIRASSIASVVKDLSMFNMLFVDEGHRSASDEYLRLLKCIGAACRLTVSGTPFDHDDKVKAITIMGISSTVMYKVTNAELIDKGISRKPTVHIYPNKSSSDLMPTFPDYGKEHDAMIVRSTRRMSIIKWVVSNNKGRKIVITYEDLEHGAIMMTELENRFPELKIDIVNGSIKSQKIRNKILEDFTNGDTDVLFASKIFNEGINTTMHMLIRAGGGKSKINTKQISGRTTRRMEGETEVDIIDFYDVSTTLAKHSRKRIADYTAEGFTVIKHYDKKYNIVE